MPEEAESVEMAPTAAEVTSAPAAPAAPEPPTAPPIESVDEIGLISDQQAGKNSSAFWDAEAARRQALIDARKRKRQ